MEKIHKTQIISLNNKVMLIIIYTIIIIKKIIVIVNLYPFGTYRNGKECVPVYHVSFLKP